MEARVQLLEETVIKLFQTLLTRAEVAEARITKLEALLNTQDTAVVTQAQAQAQVQAQAQATPRKRKQTKHSTYLVIKGLFDSGKSEKDIAIELGEPYTTVRSYLQWTPEQVEKKRIEEMKQQERQAKQQRKREASVISASSDNNTNTIESTVVEDSIEEAVIDDIIDVAFTQNTQAPVEGEGYIVECPPADGELGEHGWYQWTRELKEFAEKKQSSDGYPLYPPLPRGTVVKVQYMNGVFDDPQLSQSVDWTGYGGVQYWKQMS